MSHTIGVISQKGGVAKSTIARALGTTYAAAGWNVKIADLDINQASSFSWHQRRLQRDASPSVAVETFGAVKQAMSVAHVYDMMILDGAPHATKATALIAQHADMVILPTGMALDDLEPQVMLANALADEHRVRPDRIVFALVKTGSSAVELSDTIAYLGMTRFSWVPHSLPERTAYRRAQDAGLSVTETPYPAPRAHADQFVQGIIDRFEEITQ